MTSFLVEAESFKDLGGWVIDQQSMLQMGSAYLMAHGKGIPVPDACTDISVPKAGTWSFWVRTRDWTAHWQRGTPAGRFQLLINGEALKTELGTNGPLWAWQKAGQIWLEEGIIQLALHDLTGFNGRCDAIYLTDAGDTPPDDAKALAAFRREKAQVTRQDDKTLYDLAVAGGGVAGLCTALTATRLGLRVVLLHDRPVLGGANSSEIRVGMGGLPRSEPYPNLGNTVAEIGPIMGSGASYRPAVYFEDARKSMVFELNNGPHPCNVVLNTSVVEVETAQDDTKRITALVARSIRTGHETRYFARQFADCTGDAVLARLLGAETMYGTEGRDRFDESLAPEIASRQVMGHSLMWYAKEQDEPVDFPAVDWGLEFDEDRALYVTKGDWEWESGQYRDQAEETEYIRDYGMMALYANWSYVKNQSHRQEEWRNYDLEWVSALGGKRESYRVVGDLVLTQNDIENRVDYPDATVGMTWNIDLHYPDPDNEAKFPEPFRACAYHRGIGQAYPVPYRCLYAKDIKNLFLGGRIISVSHVAFACVRVMRTLGALGEVIGMAAALCGQHDCDPRQIYSQHLDELVDLMKKGVPVPCHHGWPPDNSESYHFEELGFIRFYPKFTLDVKDKPLVERIKKLKVNHKYPHPPF